MLCFFEQVLPHVDIMLHDHKMTDTARHKKWVGVGNERILENFKKAYETFPNIEFIARTPLIPGINADEEHIRSVLEFIRPHKKDQGAKKGKEDKVCKVGSEGKADIKGQGCKEGQGCQKGQGREKEQRHPDGDGYGHALGHRGGQDSTPDGGPV